MGKVFLILIAAGIAYGLYGIASHVSRLSKAPEVPAAVSEAPRFVPVKGEGQDSGHEIKTPPASTSKQNSEPVAVLASNHEWLLIEAWGMISTGDELPDGTTLESWDDRRLVVRDHHGRREVRRIRTVLEALAKLAPGVAAASQIGLLEASNK
jgi:hypothetical protein